MYGVDLVITFLGAIMKLYESPSPNARRVHIFMAENGLECDRVAVDIRAAENLSAEYLARRPGPVQFPSSR